MPAQLIRTTILINQYPTLTPKPVINNSDASSIKTSYLTPFSAMNNRFIYTRGAIFGVLFVL